jgi:hypothetical protein
MRPFALLLILLAPAFSQTSPVPYAEEMGPSFTSSDADLSFPGHYASIQKVDFRKLKSPTQDAEGKSPRKISFKNLFHKNGDTDDHFSEALDAIHYLGGLSSSDGDSALVLYYWSDAGGSSSQGGRARVFTGSGGHLRLVQTLDWDTHFETSQPTVSFDKSTNTLLIRTAHYIPGDAHCCVTAMDVVTYRWNGTRLVQSGLETELSEYGKSEGKTLPKR